jgi:hypothetical protein
MLFKHLQPSSLYTLSRHSGLGSKMQDIIDYAESRFRAILTITLQEENNGKDHDDWVYRLLHRELVS